jgi:hypothetical protein
VVLSFSPVGFVFVNGSEEVERSYRGKAFFASFRSCYQGISKKTFPSSAHPARFMEFPTGFLPKIRITCQRRKLKKNVALAKRLFSLHRGGGAGAEDASLPSIVSTREIKKPPRAEAWRLFML